MSVMTGASPLPARSEQILCSIVKTFIETGQPVASADISRLRRHHLSPAAIRMAMASLAGEGYLNQPHASAGRIPTEKAFQVFVDSLPGHRVQSAELGRIREQLGDPDTIEHRAGRCSAVLTQLTNGLAITVAIPTSAQTLDQVELLSLGGKRVLMIVVTRDRMIRQQVVSLDEPVQQDDLVTIRNYVNQEFGGWVISSIQTELRARLERASAAYDRLMQRLTMLYDKGLLQLSVEPEVHVEGAANVVGFDLHLSAERLKAVFRVLEEKKLILQLLDRFLAQPEGQVGVRIGLGTDHPGFNEMSLIGVKVKVPGGAAVKLAVLGPMRMDYSRVMSAVLHVGRAFSIPPS